jgi:hypothetical protein
VPKALQSAQQPFAVESGLARQVCRCYGEQEGILHHHLRIVRHPLSWTTKSLGLRIISIGGLLYGFQQGVLGQALVMPAFRVQFPSIHSSASATEWLNSILQLGGWSGALASGVLCEVFNQAEIGLTALLSRSVDEKSQDEKKDSPTHVEERTDYGGAVD